jgi:predicted ATP-grasp superfamily ATP-dependent carboligase
MGAIRAFRPDVVMPIFSNAALLMMRHKEEISGISRLIPLAPEHRYRQLDDKESFLRIVESCGIPLPETYCPKSEDERKRLLSRLPYPVLLKPRISAGVYGIVNVHSPRELGQAYAALRRMDAGDILSEPFDLRHPIIQRYIRGQTYAAQCYCEDGTIKAIYIARSIRRYPLPFGPSIAYESVRHEGVARLCRKLLFAVVWYGPVILTWYIC